MKRRKGSLLLSVVLAAAGLTGGLLTLPAAAEDVLEDPVYETVSEVISEEAESTVTDEYQTEAEEEETSLYGITFAKDYREIYEALKKADEYYYWVDDELLDYAVEEAMDTAAPAPAVNTVGAESTAAKAAEVSSETGDFSSTNLREAGVDEADVVKTDGKYIYILKDASKVLIVRADKEDVSLVSEFDIDAERTVSKGQTDMYIDGDRLCVAVGLSVYSNERAGKVKVSNWYYNNWEDHTVLYTYDISDRTRPEAVGCVEQDGYYQESRKIGDIVYLYSRFRPYIDTESYEDSSIVPLVNGEEMKASDVAIPRVVTEAAYLIVSALDLNNPSEITDVKAVVSGAGRYYVSTGSLYAMNQHYERNTDRTEIVKFSLENGKIEGIGACDLKGYVNNSFSVDEYEGSLRVLTTYTGSEIGSALEALSDLLGLGYYDSDRWVRHNALFVLDEKMQLIGQVKGIAKDEEIRSARFFGDTAYFVTFRNTDPLYTADLSDPAHPKLTGELKVSGFSSYLHPYGDGRLLGIGYEADEVTGSIEGLKLSMFDVSDPQDVKETDRYVVKNITWCPAVEDYKCILADAEKNLIGFYCSDRYMVFRYDEEEGFSRALLYDFFEDMINDVTSYDTMRGLYIGDELYLAGADYVIGFDMTDGFRKNVAACGLLADE